MIPEILIFSAVRTLALGLLISLGMKLLRPRNPHVEMTVWVMVLMASFAMPLLMHWVRIPVSSRSLPAIESLLEIDPFGSSSVGNFAEPARIDGNQSGSVHPQSSSVLTTHQSEVFARRSDWRDIATALYVAVTLSLFARMGVGGFLAWRLVRQAKPVRESWTAGFDVRTLDRVLTPLTVGKSVLLPSVYGAWPPVKRDAVLAHERSHVERHDFIVQFLAAVNRCVFWFSPFSWWIEKRLIELGETASDEAAIEVIGDRASYADLLLELSREARSPNLGLAMARPNTVFHRINYILATTVSCGQLAFKKRVLLVLGVSPFILLAACSIESDQAKIAGNANNKSLTAQPVNRRIANIDPALFDKVVGKYDMSIGGLTVIRRVGDQLILTGPRGHDVWFFPETEDQYFIKTLPLTYKFAGEKDGRFETASLDSPVQHVSDLVRIEEISLDPNIYDAFVGRYDLVRANGSRAIISITRDAQHLFIGTDAYPPGELIAENSHTFVTVSLSAKITFGTEVAGHVEQLIWLEDNKQSIAKRVKQP